MLLFVAAEQGAGIDRAVLAQLTQLYMTVKLECPFYQVKYLEQCEELQTWKAEGQKNNVKPEHTPRGKTLSYAI